MSEESQNEASKNPATLSVETDPAAADSAQQASTMASQTNIGQVTEGPAAASEGAKWSCEVCTYENFPLSRKCTMCRSPKPSLNENIFSLQDGAAAAALPSPDACGAEAVAERLKPLRISSPQGTAASSVPKWACATCTYENWPKSQKCAMCGAASSAAASAPAHTILTPVPKQNIGVNEVCSSQPSSDGRKPKRRNNNTNIDWLWLQACLGVVEGEGSRVQAYLAGGGDPARALTPAEVQRLNRASAFDPGHTLVHLAIRFQRQEILSTLLSRISGGGPGLKRSPSYIAPDLASAIRRHVASCLRYKKGSFPCRYITEFCTFTLPADIEELPPAIQEQLFSELLDRDAQQTLEADPPLINWSQELTLNEGCRLYALWNRSLGDCLLDAVLQAAYGVSDRPGALRAALAAALAARPLRARWLAAERRAAHASHYAPTDGQLRADWARLQRAADQPHHALAHVHVFALAHVMRRPLLVYGVDLVSSFRGEPLGYARFQGIYLPLLWEPEFCSQSPLSIGYTRGHFCALVPLEPYRRHYIYREQQEEGEDVTLLPLTDCEGKLLPVHFLTCEEMEDPEGVVRRWMSTVETASGLLAARQAHGPRPLLQAQMMEEWLNHYRRLAQQSRGPFPPRLHAENWSDPDTDDDD